MQVEARNLCMSFDDAGRKVDVFKDLNLKVETGTSIAIVGESGVGKTTLLYLIGGLEQPVSGEVLIGGGSLTELQRSGNDVAAFRGKNIGFVFQSPHLFPEFDAVENVSMPLLIQGVSKEVAEVRATDLLKRVGLGHRLTHRPGALSGGEQQRVALARALSGKPGVILADEPTGNLDHLTGSKVSDLLLEMHREEGITLIVVTHSKELAMTMGRTVELTPNGFLEKA